MSTFKLGPIQEQWLQSLEQHPERQMGNKLGEKFSDGTYKACCLGELGLMAGVCEWGKEGLLHTIVKERTHNSISYLEEVYTEVGLHSHSGIKIVNGKINSDLSLSSLNDGRKSWPEIAAIVRANPEHYFNKSV